MGESDGPEVREADLPRTAEACERELDATESKGGVRHLLRAWQTVPSFLEACTECVLYVALISELGVLFLEVVMRNLVGSSFLWSDEIAQLALVVLTFIGGAYAYSQNSLGAVLILVNKLPSGLREIQRAFGPLTVGLIALALTFLGVQMLPSQGLGSTPVLGISYRWYLVPFIVGMALIVLQSVRRLAAEPAKNILFALGAFAILALAEYVVDLASNGATTASSVASILSLAIFLALGIPIAFVLMLAGSVYLLDSHAAPFSSAVTNMSGGVMSIVLLAIPFFILAGFILTHTTLGRTLLDFINTLVGRIPGGLLHAVVVTMYLFSGLSGSKVADVAAVGSSVAGPADEAGYSRVSVASVLAASAVMGEAVPPSISMVVLSSVAGISIVGLFLGGILPAALIGLLVMAMIFAKARKEPRADETGRIPLRTVAISGMRALPVLAIPVFLVGGIVSGIASPTEVSAIAVVGALIVGVLYGSLKGSTLRMIGQGTAATSGLVLLMISGASNFSWSLTVAGLPDTIAGLLQGLGHSSILFIVATIVVVPILGTVLEGMPAILIFGPIFVPIAEHLGINPIQYGVVFVLSLGLGAFAPPMGVGLYATCAVCEVSVEAVAPALARYWAVIAAGLVILAVAPPLSLWLPQVLGVS